MATFFLYKQDKQEGVRKQNPDMKISDITCQISDLWKKEADHVKADYLVIYDQNKKKYDENMAAYVKEHGKPDKRKKKKNKDDDKKEKKAKKNAEKKGKTSAAK